MTLAVKKVFVVDLEGKPLLPTHPARARKLLKSGSAVMFAVAPFTIQLKKLVSKPVGNLTLNINDGTKEVGLAVINKHTQEIVFSGVAKLKQDIKNKLIQGREYCRARRYRKIRYQKVHFDKKIRSLPPGTLQKKESILRVAKELKRFMNIKHVVLEQGKFNDYQSSRAEVLLNNEYSCQSGLKIKTTLSNKRHIYYRFGYRLNSSGIIYYQLILNIFFYH